MSFARDYKESFWFSSLFEFGEEIFVCNRKRFRISQSKIASKLGLSQSEISRLERGLTRPKNIIIAQDLCDAYKLSSTERKKYLELIAGTPILPTDAIGSLVENQIESIAYLNRSGSPKQAIQLAQNLGIWLESNNRDLLGNSNLNSQMAHLMLEESAAWWDIMLPTEVGEYTEPLLHKMENIPNSLDDSISVYTSINKGFHAYINNKYESANQHFMKALSNENQIDTLWRIETLRASLITFGKLKNFDTVLKLERQANNLIENVLKKSIEKGYILEGIARAYAEFNLDKSIQYFEIAQKYINQARNEPNFMNIRLIQFVRSYLVVLKSKDTNHDKLVQLAAPALEAAEKSGFERHKNQIFSVLNS